MQFTSSYSSELNSYSQLYCRVAPCQTGNYSYEAIELIVLMSGSYILTCNAAVDSFGYLYNETFDPVFPNLNLLVVDDDSAGNSQFQMQYFLEATGKYMLVVTTYAKNELGTFSIRVRGPGTVNFTRTNVTSESSSLFILFFSTDNLKHHKFPSDRTEDDLFDMRKQLFLCMNLVEKGKHGTKYVESLRETKVQCSTLQSKKISACGIG